MANKYIEFWNPMTGSSSWAPINSAQLIPGKAREILKGRTKEDVDLMIAFVHSTVKAYYQSDRERVEEEIERDENWEMAEIDEEGHITEILDAGIDHYGLVDENYPFAFAVAFALDECNLDDDYPPTKKPQPQEYELWAALCLSEFAQYMYGLEHTFNFKSYKYEKRVEKNYSALEVVKFANQLLDSYEMLNTATAMFTESKIYNKTAQQHKKTQEQIKLKRSEISKNANLVRHHKTNNLKQTILNEWEKNKHNFKTIKDAGDHFEEVMNELEHKITTETIRGYISEHAKTIGFTFPRQQKSRR